MNNPTLATLLEGTPYASYAYSYPHKTAYGPLDPPVSLADAWRDERRDALFLYLHLPFCEMRCGFCNLFTTIERQNEVHARYLQQLAQEAEQVAVSLGTATFARMAIGGGTPTILAPELLDDLLEIAARFFDAQPAHIPTSIETSPQTATPARLQILRARGVSRISMGVQSFVEAEARAAGRPQNLQEVEAALQHLKAADFPILNLDLMYGLPGQTRASWLASLRRALEYAPEELYLYPLYVRPLTGLEKRGASQGENGGENRLELYRTGRDFLRENGYHQVSMRMFARSQTSDAPLYCCQQDGMVGVGCGARSYTQRLHYSREYAVSATGVRAILDDYGQRDAASFRDANYGFWLDDEERKRRFLIQSLLQSAGLSFDAYCAQFESAALDDVEQLQELAALELATDDGKYLRLNDAGLERADVIGPWLASARVVDQMTEFALQ